jgi:hypothetical protein
MVDDDKPQLMHPAADIFLEQLLIHVDEENDKIRECNMHLKPARDILTEIELILHDGTVVFAAQLTQSFLLDYDGPEGHQCDIGITLNTAGCPLLNFTSGDLKMMGRTVGCLGGSVELMAVRYIDSTILLRFSLSQHIVLEGILQGLSADDFACFVTKSYTNSHIVNFLTTGMGLHNATTLTFTPVILLVELSQRLQSTLELIGQRPSQESVMDNLTSQIEAIVNGYKLISPPSEMLILSTIAAVGCNDERLKLLAQNQLLKCDNSSLIRIQEMLGMVEIVHPFFTINVSLMNGKLCNRSDNSQVWRVGLYDTAVPHSVIRHSMNKLRVFLAGMLLTTSNVFFSTGADLDGFRASSVNGTEIIGLMFHSGLVDVVQLLVELPLSCVQSNLRAIGVDV